MLACIPAKPEYTSTENIQNQLYRHGYNIHIRSIQRDLNSLKKIFPVFSKRYKKNKTVKLWSLEYNVFTEKFLKELK